MKKITIIIQFYNNELNDIMTSLNSVINQKHNGYKLILFDNGSDDSKNRNKLIKDGYTVHFTETNTSIGDGRNKSLSYVDTEYFMRLDAGDSISDNAISNIYKYLSKGYGALYLKRSDLNRKSEPFMKLITQRKVVETNSAPHNFVLKTEFGKKYQFPSNNAEDQFYDVLIVGLFKIKKINSLYIKPSYGQSTWRESLEGKLSIIESKKYWLNIIMKNNLEDYLITHFIVGDSPLDWEIDFLKPIWKNNKKYINPFRRFINNKLKNKSI